MNSTKLLQDQAYDIIMKMLKSGEIKPGIIYSETQIANDIGISRTPFKNALVRLKQDKYVDILPSRGFKIHAITEEDVSDTYQVRSAIEGFAVVYLTKNKNSKNAKENIAKLKKNLDLQKEIIETTKNIKDFLKLDNSFHETIIKFVDNKEFNEIFNNYIYRISEIASSTLSIENRLKGAYNEHNNIYEAILSGNVEKAYHSILEHVEFTKQLYLEKISNRK